MSGSQKYRPSRAYNSETEAEPRRTFGASGALAVVSAIVPGLGLAGTRWRRFGIGLTVVAVAAALIGLAGATVARGWGLSVIASATWLTVLAIAVPVFGLAVIVAVIATHLLTRPRPVRGWQRVLGALLVGVLTFAVALPSAYGSRALLDTAQVVRDVFQDSDDPGGVPGSTFGNAGDPWANKPRLNVLILGADTGDDRVGTRTDTVMVASINTKTGDTVLIGLPRQTERIVFPKDSGLAKIWPTGFHLSGQPDGEQMVNAMYENVVSHPGAKKLIPPAKDPGAKVLELAVGASLGLDIDYYVMADLRGFEQIIDALGGVKVNINKPVPVGGKNPNGSDPGFPPDRWLPPGPDKHLNGVDALWYARGRYHTDDYDRMRRQRCVIRALSHQVNPGTVLANYDSLTQAGRTVIQTDVPSSLLPALLDLSGKVRNQPLRSLSFHDGKNGFSTANPRWPLVRQQVANALNPPPPEAPKSAGPTHSVPPSSSKVSKKPVSASVEPTADECAYSPR